ncbi:MAG: TonB-dependent receptor domain-containing protein [Burkholderiales bacterium]
MTKSLPRAAAALAFLFCPLFAAAQRIDDAVVVTATRIPTRVSAVVSDVSVITREEIEQAGVSSLAEILQAQPGVEITQNGGLGTASSVFLRGTSPTQVLVLVDGLRVGSATTGTTAFQDITPSQIERIEIVRGPMSSLYGADAMGGVIQIFTRAERGPVQASGSAGWGTWSTQQYTAGIGGSTGDTTFNVNAGYLSSRSFSAVQDPTSPFFQPDADGYRNTSASARLAHRLTPDDELGGTLFWSSGRIHFDGFMSTFDDYTDQSLAAYGVYSKNRFLPAWQSLLRVGQGIDDSTTVSGPTSDVFKTTQDQVTWQNDLTTPVGDFLLAAEYLGQRVSGTTAFAVDDRTIWSLLGGYTGRSGPHTLQANLRRDDNSQFGGETTGSVGYGYAVAPGWRVSAAYGTAFRAPTFNELYFPPAFGCPAFGNPNLRPETSNNLEAGVRYEGGGQTAGVIAFQNRISDLVVSAAIPGNPFCVRAENVQDAQITGVTLTYGLARDGWTVRASVDIQNPKNETLDRQLPFRAKEHGAISVARSVGPWQAGIEFVASGPRYNNIANTQRLGSYSLVNLFGEYRVAAGWSIFARVNNLLNEDYQLVRGFATPGFNVFAGVRYAPK